MKFFGELLLFVLLLVINLRIYFAKRARLDSLVMLSPLCVLLAFLQILAWGLEVFTFLALIISILVLLSNFHALFRYSSRLYVDHYSPLMKTWAFFTNALSVFSIALLIFFMPIENPRGKLGVTETPIKYKGSFNYGFSQIQSFDSADLFVYEFSKVPEIVQKSDVVLFIPDKRADTAYYKPYLELLASQGFTVCSADFFAKDMKWHHSIADSKYSRRFFMMLLSLANENRFMSQKEFYTYNSFRECEVLTELLDSRYGDKCRYFLIGDVMADDAISDFQKIHPEKVSGILNLDFLESYHTPGYGICELTDPLLAAVLGFKKDFDGELLKELVLTTSKHIYDAWGILKD